MFGFGFGFGFGRVCVSFGYLYLSTDMRYPTGNGLHTER
jgi:hypothetical protein